MEGEGRRERGREREGGRNFCFSLFKLGISNHPYVKVKETRQGLKPKPASAAAACPPTISSPTSAVPLLWRLLKHMKANLFSEAIAYTHTLTS